MIYIRQMIKTRNGFTLVELMVVVVVLGILAGIAVQRMGDVRDRAETAAREANVRLLLGAANLALARNYEDYMYIRGIATAEPQERNVTIRWQRPCEGPPVTQLLGQSPYIATGTPTANIWNYMSGYNLFAEGLADVWLESPTDPTGIGIPYYWNPSSNYNLEDYFESFPVGYAVELVFAARTLDGDIWPGGNTMLTLYGYHRDRNSPTTGTFTNPYDIDQILIYKFVGTATTEEKNWDPLNPCGSTGSEGTYGNTYPYHQWANSDPVTSDDWREVFPVDRW